MSGKTIVIRAVCTGVVIALLEVIKGFARQRRRERLEGLLLQALTQSGRISLHEAVQVADHLRASSFWEQMTPSS